MNQVEGRNRALSGRIKEMASLAGLRVGGTGGQACSPPGISVSSLRGGTVSSLSVYILAAFRCRYRASISFRVRGTRQLKTQQRVITTERTEQAWQGPELRHPRNSTQIPGLSPSIYVGLTQESLFRRFHLLTKPLWALRFPKYLLLAGLALGGRPALRRALCLV